ncbi:DUF1223 domain-containing protein [Shewanella sp. 3B26]|uniref:DUF1223 domain-containing protein n=1 Tax=Shewanella zhuhaiensis TaxID=2919576 RepID=A0AAJ1BII5_9GAMM|nr:DUF1223 domain-containing protein [Shewanella zhuhaiensis]MCH4295358.1 DUF1223 domain-containing protein [Shewanella zhuhaiensis]
MRLLWLFVLPALLAMPLSAVEFSARSENPDPIIIELYTSQGCSSCPPAEEWLSAFAKEKDLWHKYFPLAFHVSYWDYLGWKDPLADKRFGKRQYAHWNRKHSKGVYTPQIFIGGDEWRGGEDRGGEDRGGELHRATAAAPLSLSLKDKRLNADYGAQAPRLNLAIVGVGIHTPVAKGENRGKTLQQDFAVLSLYQFDNQSDIANVSRFGGELELDMDALLRRAPRLALVAWVEEDMQPLQAVGGWLTP